MYTILFETNVKIKQNASLVYNASVREEGAGVLPYTGTYIRLY